jgi:asparagine synthetase B (glutamine-hydrolysing)
MCGLVGVAGNLSLDAVKAFNNLLYIDALRGMDSTGVASVAFNKDISVLKQVGPALDLIETKAYDNHVSVNKWVLIGHNRFGTIGPKTKANAHPFEHNGIVGAHNGTLTHGAKTRMLKHLDFGTDSEAMIHNISVEGVIETALKLEGAWAVTYYDSEDNTINLFRNNQRPLFYAFSKDRKQLFWASEQLMLILCLRRNGIDFEMFELPVGKLYSWVVPRGSNMFGDVTEPTELKEYVAPPYVSRFLGDQGSYKWDQGQGGCHSTGSNVVTYESPAQKNAKAREEIQKELEELPWEDLSIIDKGGCGWSEAETLDEYVERKLVRDKADEQLRANDKKSVITQIEYKNPRTNAIMTKDEFEVITKTGCDWCGQTVHWGEAVKFAADTAGDVECFCFECVDGRDGLNRYLGTN